MPRATMTLLNPASPHSLIIAALVPILAACGPQGGHGPTGGMPPVAVSIVTVQPQNIPVNFEYTGQTAGSREVEIRSRAAGIMQKRNYTEGTIVRGGPIAVHDRCSAV